MFLFANRKRKVFKILEHLPYMVTLKIPALLENMWFTLNIAHRLYIMSSVKSNCVFKNMNLAMKHITLFILFSAVKLSPVLKKLLILGYYRKEIRHMRGPRKFCQLFFYKGREDPITIKAGHHWPTSKMPFKWHFTGGPMMAHY